MCVSTPTITQPKTEAPVQSISMNAADSTIAQREGDRQRRLRALSRFQTMQGGSMQGSEAENGKVRLGA